MRSCAAGRSDPGGQHVHDGRTGRTGLDEAAGRKGGFILAAQTGHRGRADRAQPESQGLAIRAERHHPLGPARVRPHELADGQGVEELVGEHDQRLVDRQFGHRVVPGQRDARTGQGGPLPIPQAGAAFDQVDRHGLVKRRQHAGRPQRVDHRRAAAGAQFDQRDPRRTARPGPPVGRPQAQQLSEHLADLRGGDEIATATERIPAPIIAVTRVLQGLLHVLGDRQRPGLPDPPGQSVPEASRVRPAASPGHVATGRGAWRQAHMARATPPTIIGMLNSCPMVAPSHRKPSWGSGSRTNSIRNRPAP